MNLNATLLGQMITFSIFVWFTMKFIWPPVIKALQDRQKKIAEGLDAAERSVRSLELSKQESAKILREMKTEASGIVDQANLRASKIVEHAKARGQEENRRLVLQGQSELEQIVEQAKVSLRQQTVEIALASAAKVFGTQVDKETHEKMLTELIDQI